jgi:hypothetical protein
VPEARPGPGPLGQGRRLGAIRETLAECDARLARYRHALEAGADPAVVAGWIRDVQAERRSIEHEFGGMAPAAVWSAEDMQALVESVGDLVAVLRGAEPQKKAELYGELGLTLTYDIVEADLSRVRMVRVGGPTRTLRTPLVAADQLRLSPA